MKGLELARAYYDFCLPILSREIPDLLELASIGLCGEGSECFGMDDAFSRDHDFGAAFCLWLPDEQLRANISRLDRVFSLLPGEFAGLSSRFADPAARMRVGPQSVEAFFHFFTGLEHLPGTCGEWLSIPEYSLAAATNGEIFADNCELFKTWRKTLLGYYPQDVYLKKLAARAMQIAQAGQYNLPRCLKRGDSAAALLAYARFAEAALALVYLLNRRYMPYYKWAAAMAAPLPILGREISSVLDSLTARPLQELDDDDCAEIIEPFCEACAEYLHKWSGQTDAWLWNHGPAIAAHIRDDRLRKMNLLQD